jgi:hypothetical protein
MMRVNPISLNKISYDSVITALETIRDVKPSPPIVDHVYVDTGAWGRARCKYAFYTKVAFFLMIIVVIVVSLFLPSLLS